VRNANDRIYWINETPNPTSLHKPEPAAIGTREGKYVPFEVAVTRKGESSPSFYIPFASWSLADEKAKEYRRLNPAIGMGSAAIVVTFYDAATHGRITVHY
jgi:hypothetical protein